MTEIAQFTFNPFQENTFILYDDSGECVVIDPGNSDEGEDEELKSFIESRELKVKYLLNTHCHVDHVMGNAFVEKEYDLKPIIHKADLPVLQAMAQYGELFGVRVRMSPEPEEFMKDGDVIRFGNSELEVMHIPGHAPGHVVLICREDKFVIGGDVLFYGSIGRTDLPYCDHDTLIRSIKEKFFKLDDVFRVHPGHGPSTSIGQEKKSNPFLR